MATPLLTPTSPVSTVQAAMTAMRQIESTLPASDGVACFNRMYLDVTQKVSAEIDAGGFDDSAFATRLDVVFANLYFAAVNSYDGTSASVPVAWRPLFAARSVRGIAEIQFALAGMNAH